MKASTFRTLLWLIPIALASTGITLARDLAFEERVEAQEAIERVYYSHQIGATKPFEEAVPRAVLEGKVRKYLQQTAALEVYWKTPVTDEMLQRELERMARGTRLPDRLRELFAALNEDPFLIQECLARATLVDRLTRNFYAFDPTLHAGARQRAEEIHRQLAAGEIDPWRDHPDRAVVELIERDEVTVEPGDREREAGLQEKGQPTRRLLSQEEFRKERAKWPKDAGSVAPVAEEREAFVIRAVLSDAPGESRLAAYVVPKRAWDLWWEGTKTRLQGERVAAAASEAGALPLVGTHPGERPGVVSGSAGTFPDPLEEDILSCENDDTWDDIIVLYDAPTQRDGHTAVWTGSLMIVWGGTNYVNYQYVPYKTGGRYDPATDSWTPTSTTGAPSARYSHTAVWTGNLMVVWGGGAAVDSPCVNTGGRYDPATDSWTPTSTVGAPSAREQHTAVWTGTRMVVWGGQYYEGAYLYLNTGGRYDPATDSWTPTSTVGAPSARYRHTAVWTGTLMVVWGGYGGTYVNSGGRYDPDSESWAPTSTLDAPSARAHHSAVWTGTLMIVWGGFPSSDTGGKYDPAIDSWTPTSTVDAPIGRSCHTAVWTGTSMVVWGGTNFDYDFNTGGRYDPATDSWTPTSTVGAPYARWNHTAVWTGTLMVVWGGYRDLDVYFDSGGRYDPATDSWTPTSMGESPYARSRHTAVWTGTLMVVWGGTTNVLPYTLNTGGRYDPATDSWTPTSTTDAPSARQYPTAVWTGTLMVVWGGSPYTNTGGRYDPAADSWTPTSTVGAPSPRSNHTAVWTGTLMVIWGGYGGTYVDTGGRYNPVTDSWAPTSTTDVPSARSSHTAVWTGTVMVVWGGYISVSPYRFNTGGRYDPVTDSWTPTATTDAPSARSSHTAVWTGALMIVWGGSPSSDTGGRYDLATDSWTPTSTVGAPTARYKQTAAWTGTVMVIWGGYGGAYLNTGGRYNPAADSWTATSTVGAPSPRYEHTAVWTGTLMAVWGGYGGVYRGDGGRYVVINAAIDGDADGFTECEGDCDNTDARVYPGAPQICDGLNNDCSDPAWPAVPADEADADGDGVIICAGDCDDADPAIYAEAPEANDGLDNQCPGDAGFGIVDEISGALIVGIPPGEISWPAQTGATAYEVIRSLSPLFPPVCDGGITGVPSWSDPEIPSEGGVIYYLVRPVAPYVGSWGVDSSGVERAGLCGEE